MTKLLNNIAGYALALVLLAVLTTSCHQQQKFTPEKWDMGDGLTFSMRDGIVEDLLQTHKFVGMKYRQVRHLLRHPQYGDSTRFSYDILETHTNMLKPDRIKKLIFYIRKDSVITKVELYDNKAPVKSRFF